MTPLQQGAVLVTKRMEAGSGMSLPRHKASMESVLVVTEGQCVLELPDAQPALRAGESFIVPADVWHRVTADPEFKAIHVMPKEIRFEF